VLGFASGAGLAAGSTHTCARTTGGGLTCWGGGEQGQLGDALLLSHSTPVRVLGFGRADFDGDDKRDIALYRPTTGLWLSLDSTTNNTTSSQWDWDAHAQGDTPLLGDFDGDGLLDPAIFRPATGTWFLLPSAGAYSSWDSFAWGSATDRPISGDYDGDGTTDAVLYRPVAGTWYVRPSSGATPWNIDLGSPMDVPVPGDYDGDGKADPAVYRASTGTWLWLKSSADYTAWDAKGWDADPLSDIPAPGDYDGDGKTDLCLFRASAGTWTILLSGAHYTTWQSITLGAAGDLAVPADYDGDGKTDAAVYRPSTSTWYVRPSGGTGTWTIAFGETGDAPIVPTPLSPDVAYVSVRLTAPSAGTAFPPATDIPLAADVTALNASIVRVEFRVDGATVASATTAPYAATWTGATSGVHAVVAAAVDSLGGTTLSSAVSVSVLASGTGVLAAPRITPAGGTLGGSIRVAMEAAAGAVIRYTSDGTDPAETSTAYSAPLTVAGSLTLRARAFQSGWTTSAQSSAVFEIAGTPATVAAPVLSLPAGEYPSGQMIIVFEATAGAVLHYTTTGDDPTEADASLPPGGTLVLGNFLLKVRAYKTGWTPSAVTFANYTVTGSGSLPSVGAGDRFSLASSPDGELWAWGMNIYGNLGDGATTTRCFPARVLQSVNPATSLTNVVSVAAANTSSFAVRQGGAVKAWGENQCTLGDGTCTNRSLPVAVIGLNDGRAVSSRYGHSLAIRTDGTVWSWGKNAYGELGDGSTTVRGTPVQVVGLTNAVAVATGLYGSVALLSDGTVRGWGLNNYGQVGDGTATNRLTPVPVVGLSNVVAIASGTYFRIAIKSDGTVWGWGSGTATPAQVAGLSQVLRISAGAWHAFAVREDGTLWAWGGNNYGQLGDGTTTDRASPILIAGPNRVVAIIGGAGHSVAVTADGTVWTWGSNSAGELGDSTWVARPTPAAISGPGMAWRVSTPTIGLASGTYQAEQSATVTCTYAGAVLHYTTSGVDPTESDPVVASGGAVAISQSLTLKVRGFKTGAVPSVVAEATYALKAVKPVITPTSGTYASTVTVTATSTTSAATLRVTADGTEPSTSSAVLDGSGLSLEHTATVKVRAEREGWTPSDTAVASYFLVAASSDTVTFAPNGGTFSEPPVVWLSSPRTSATIRYTLDGTDPTASSPAYAGPLRLTLGTTVSARLFEAGYAVGPVSTATFASSDAGATASPRVSPAGGLFPTQRTVTVTADADAVLRYTTNGADPIDTDTLVPTNRTILVDRSLVLKVRAWRTGLQPSPVRRADFVISGAVATGTAHDLALKADGTVRAWGSNSYGQLGDSTTTSRTTPTQVSGLTNVVAIATGSRFSLAVKADGTVWSWGDNAYGQLGAASPSYRAAAAQITALTGVVAVAAGDSHALAVKQDGTVWSWGRNDQGQLGDGTTTNRSTPVQVLGIGGVSLVEAGDAFSIAIETAGANSGRVWAWGKNDKGQVGDGATATRLVPVRLPIVPASRAIAAGADWAAAVDADGVVWTWGGNASGQLGTGVGANRASPAEVAGLPPILSVAAGSTFGLGASANGSAWAWGSNGKGQFGMSVDTCASAVCAIPVRLPWEAPPGMAGGGDFSVVVAAAGTVATAGGNASGQLGTGGTQDSAVQVSASGLTLAANTWLAADADGDGLSTWREWLAGTDPLSADTNGNGIPDGIEVAAGRPASSLDSDGDGVPDELEARQGTDPFVADTDGDGVSDPLDAFPLDPGRTQPLVADPNDVTAPTITLTAPTTARWIR
jgi:alpha-tubulin suppressor-like RCC1 family protein